MKKIISFLLIIAVAFCSVSCGKKAPADTPSENSGQLSAKPVDAAAVFDDVEPGDWFEASVSWGVSEGIMEAAKPSSFGVADAMSKAELILSMWKAAGAPGRVVSAKALPSDDPDSDYQRALKWALERQLIEDKSVASDDATRLDAVELMWKEAAMPYADAAVNFDDTEGIESVAWAKAAKIAYGIGNNLFDPYSACVKAHMITFLYRAK